MNTWKLIHKVFNFLLAFTLLGTVFTSQAASFSNPPPSGPSDDVYWQPGYTINGPNRDVYTMAFDNQGQLYLGGIFLTVGDAPIQGLVRWTPTRDGYGTWSKPGGWLGGFVNTLIWADGHLYVGGSLIRTQSLNNVNIARWTPDSSGQGGTWDAVGAGLAGEVKALTYDYTNHVLYAGGVFMQTSTGIPVSRVASYRENTGWSTLPCPAMSEGLSGAVYTLAWTPEGLYAGGSFDSACSGLAMTSNIARWTQAGGWQQLASGTGEGTDGDVYSLAYDTQAHHLYVGGYFRHAGGIAMSGLSRWNLSGSSWSVVHTGFNAAVTALQWHPVRKLVIGGSLIEGLDSMLATYDPSTDSLVAVADLQPTWSGTVRALASSGNTLFAGGTFQGANGKPALHVARFGSGVNVSLDIRPIRGMTGNVNAMVPDGKGGLYLGGEFLFAGSNLVNNIAHWTPGEAGGTFAPLISGLDGPVNALAYDSTNGVLYIGGRFDAINGSFTAHGLACWIPFIQDEGGSWSACGGDGVDGYVNALAVDLDGHVYVGGVFTQAGGAAHANLARYNPADDTWDGIGDITGTAAQVFSLLATGNSLFIGGYFENAGGKPANNIAFWHPQLFWSTLIEGGATGVSGPVYGLAYVPDTTDIYIGGRFPTAGTIPDANDIARWQGLERKWYKVPGTLTDLPEYFSVKTLAFDSEGGLYAGGTIFHYDTGIRSLARFNGSDWTGVGTGVSGPVNSLVAYTSRSLFAGGNFSQAGSNVISSFFAHWQHPIYVDAHATSGAKTGENWQNAYTELSAALAIAGPGDEIWVAEGTYKPSGDRTAAFVIPSLVRVYGGFSGVETSLADRDWGKHVTILSGEIGAMNVKTDNTYHVVDLSYAQPGTILDGFTIESGYADGDGYAQMVGGGILNLSGKPTLNHLVIANNYARSTGGGLYNFGGSARLINTIFYKNKSLEKGGGVRCENSSLTASNVTFSGNQSAQGGAISSDGEMQILENFILWDNPSSGSGEFYSDDLLKVNLQNGILKGGCPSGLAPGDCSHVLNINPQFIDAAHTNFHLGPLSAAIDAGEINSLIMNERRDDSARPRIVGLKGLLPLIDLGAFEAQARAALPVLLTH